MAVINGNFEAFITNLGKYNEGELVGEWVEFPTTQEEIAKAFDRIGIGKEDEFGNPYEEWFITDYDCPIHGIYDMLGEYENLDKLNYLASLIDELSDYEQEIFVSILESGCSSANCIDDLINLTFSLDAYGFIPDVESDSDLGYYHVHETGIYNERDFGIVANYIDYESLGRDIRLDEGGQFTEKGYVYTTGEDLKERFDGSIEAIPVEYRVTGFEGEIENKSTMTVIIVEPGKEACVKEIGNDLASMQHVVGGSIQIVYPFQEQVCIVCNDEGKLIGLPLNRALRDDDGDIYDIIAGTFMVVGLTADDVGSLTDEQAQKYTERFKNPEQFVRFGDKIIAIPVRVEGEITAEKDNNSNDKSKKSVKDKLKNAKANRVENRKINRKKDKNEREI